MLKKLQIHYLENKRNILTLNPQLLLGIFFAVFFGLNSHGQKDIHHRQVFKSGEIINYQIFYQWGFIWVEAGTVSFQAHRIQHKGQEAYEFVGHGKTLEKWDWMYKVRDVYRSVTDTNAALSPLYFERKVQEGSNSIHNLYEFDQEQKQIYSTVSTSNKGYKKDTLQYQEGIYDVLSMIYHARQLDYRQYKKGERIPIRLILDKEIHETHIEYLGLVRLKIKDKGYINCFKFKPLLIEGTIFNAGDEMTVWVSADQNRVPVKVETPILVGSIKVYIDTFTNTIVPLKFDPGE